MLLTRICSSIGNAVAFSAMTALVSAAVWSASLVLTVTILNETSKFGFMIFFSILFGWMVTTFLGFLYLFFPVFLTSFILCGGRQVTQRKFLLLTLSLGTVIGLGFLMWVQYKVSGFWGWQDINLNVGNVIPLLAGICAYAFMGLKFIWEENIGMQLSHSNP